MRLRERVYVLTILAGASFSACGGGGAGTSVRTPVNITSAFPVLFGGFLGNVTPVGSSLTGTINPATNSSQCPTGYTASTIYGTAAAPGFPGDAMLQVCTKQSVDGDVPILDFGGMYGEGTGPVYYPNPFTGALSCPANFQKQEILNTGYVDWDLWYCYRLSDSTETLSTYQSFAGLYGQTSLSSVVTDYPNPVTGAASTCPTTAPYPNQVFGTPGVDYPIFLCSATSASATPTPTPTSTPTPAPIVGATFSISFPAASLSQVSTWQPTSGTCQNVNSTTYIGATVTSSTYNQGVSGVSTCVNGGWSVPLSLEPPTGMSDTVTISFYLFDSKSSSIISGTSVSRVVTIAGKPTSFSLAAPVAGVQATPFMTAKGVCDANTEIVLSYVGNALSPTPSVALTTLCNGTSWQIPLAFKPPTLGAEFITLNFSEHAQQPGSPSIPSALANVTLQFGVLPPAMKLINAPSTLGPAPSLELACAAGMMVTLQASATSLTPAQNPAPVLCATGGHATFPLKFTQSTVNEMVQFIAYEEGDAKQSPTEQNTQPLTFSLTLAKK